MGYVINNNVRMSVGKSIRKFILACYDAAVVFSSSLRMSTCKDMPYTM